MKTDTELGHSIEHLKEIADSIARNKPIFPKVLARALVDAIGEIGERFNEIVSGVLIYDGVNGVRSASDWFRFMHAAGWEFVGGEWVNGEVVV